MKAISLWQPWAELIRRGLKGYETRSWPMPDCLIDQPLAIHAAVKTFRSADYEDYFRRQLLMDEVDPFTLKYGCVLCVIHAHRSERTEYRRDMISERERMYGNWEDGRFAWPLLDVRVLAEPVPLKGHQGIFNWPEGDQLYPDLW